MLDLEDYYCHNINYGINIAYFKGAKSISILNDFF